MYQLSAAKFLAHTHTGKFAHGRAQIVAETPRTERHQALAEAQRAFLDEAVRYSRMTLTQIARAGQINPSTLTRFRNATGHTGLLSAATLAVVAEISGVAVPVQGAGQAPPARRGFRETEAEPYKAGPADTLASAIAALTAGGLHLVPWELRSRALEYEGYRPGDILIVDLNAEPRAGDIVCAQIYDWGNPAGTETVFRLYEPPFIIASGPVENGRKPRLVDGENVIIKGVLTASLRPRAAQSAA